MRIVHAVIRQFTSFDAFLLALLPAFALVGLLFQVLTLNGPFLISGVSWMVLTITAVVRSVLLVIRIVRGRSQVQNIRPVPLLLALLFGMIWWFGQVSYKVSGLIWYESAESYLKSAVSSNGFDNSSAAPWPIRNVRPIELRGKEILLFEVSRTRNSEAGLVYLVDDEQVNAADEIYAINRLKSRWYRYDGTIPGR